MRYANAESVRFFTRALELTSEKELAERYDLLFAREEANDLLGDRQAQEQDLQTLDELVEQLDDDNRRAEVALQRGLLALKTGEYRLARQAAGSAVRLSEASLQEDEKATRIWIDGYLILGRASHWLGEIETSWLELSRALEMAQQIGYKRGEVTALERLGSIYVSQVDYPKAVEHQQKALRLARELGDRRLERSVLNNLGAVAKERGDYQTAVDYYQQSQSIAGTIGDRLGVSMTLNNLGEIAQLQGDYGQAIGYSQRSLATSRAIGDRNGEGISLANLGETHAAIGEYPQAQEFAAQALEIVRETGFRMGEGIILGNLGKIAQNQGDYQKAKELADQALAITEEVGDRIGQGIALQGRGEALAGLGEVSSRSRGLPTRFGYLGRIG